jgi:uncharacterized protein
MSTLKRVFTAVFVTASLAFFSGCSSRVVVPPVSSPATNLEHAGKFVWFDLLTDDVQAARGFYGELFGWEFDDKGDNNAVYTTVIQNGTAIGGIVASDQLDQQVDQSRWLSYLSVPDVDAAIAKTVVSGGTTYATGTDFPERGRVGVVKDPQGALVAFVRSSSGDPEDVDPKPSRFFWTELWTSDLDAAELFYTDLVAYELDLELNNAIEGGAYRVMKKGDRRRAGMLQIPFEGVLPNWLPYIMTPDPAAMAKRAEELGGRILLAPEGVLHGGSAIIADPTGGVFGIQRWPVQNN